MAGIFALTTGSDPHTARDAARRMGEGMCLFPWQKHALLDQADQGIILGVVDNSNASVPPDAFFCEENGLHCVVEGYFIRTLAACGAQDAVDSGHYAQAAVQAYKKFGAEFPKYLEGAFTVLLFDSQPRKLIAANGRFASSLLFHYRQGDRIFYSTQLGPMARCGYFQAKPDHTNLAHLLCHGQVYSRESIIEEVGVFEPATIHSHDLEAQKFTENIYWTMGAVGHHDRSKNFEQHLAIISEALDAAGARITSRPGRYVSGLSGGLDSRLVTGIAARHKKELKTWTFGSSAAPDMIVAKQISRFLGLEHLAFTTRPELVPENSDLYSATVDSFISADFAYGLDRTRELMNHADIVLNGFAGELVLGDYVLGPKPKFIWNNLRRRKFWGPEALSMRMVKNNKNETLAWYLTAHASSPTHFVPFMSVKPASIYDRILRELENMSSRVPFEFRGEHFIHACRGSRWTSMGIMSDRHFYSDGNLFYDYDVLDACMSAPREMREANRMYSAVFRKLLPSLGAMPNANTGIRADASPGRVLFHRVASGLKKKMLRQPASRQVTGNDPNHWSRHIYPDHYLNLLADPRTRGRAFWDAEGLEKLFRLHLQGDVNAGAEFGQFAAVEFFCRRWLD